VKRTEYIPDVVGLKALAHPLRIRLLGMLRGDGPSTATALAARVGESSGTTSYHLRQLAGAGLVVEDSERGNARERWWRAAQDATRLDATEFLDDPEGRAAVEAYMSSIAAMYAARMHAWLADSGSWSRRWQSASTLSDYGLSLSAAELTRLNDELEKLIESYRRPARKGDAPVVVQYQSFPRRSS
jgi:DNA-binding transcriptional ArsR family regulator